MGFWGIVFAIAFLPAVALCMASKKYLPVGLIMGLNWMAYLVPVRANFSFGDDSLYFVLVTTATALALLIFARDLWLTKVIGSTIGALLLIGYLPLHLGLITTYAGMVIADIIGYIQIVAMYGAGGGYLFRTYRNTIMHSDRRISNLGLFGLHDSNRDSGSDS